MMLRNRMVIAFTIITLVTALSISIMVSYAIHSEFKNYVQSYKQARLNQWDMIYSNYYSLFNTWDGAQSLTFQKRGMMSGMGLKGQGGGPMSSMSENENILVINPEGIIVVDSNSQDIGKPYHQPTNETMLQQPIKVNGSTVGTLLLNIGAPSTITTLESVFLTSVNRNIIWSGLGAMLIALTLGIFFASRLSKPLNQLTLASERIADGDFTHKVSISTKDEIGKLASTFNRMVNKLERQDYLRRSLVADVAHELRTPLSIIRGNLELILSGVSEPKEEQLASLYDETLRMSYLIRDLQELSLAEAGQLKLNKKEVDIVTVINKIVSAFQLEADTKNIHIDIQDHSVIPSLFVDPIRIEQVFANLISNALRYSPSDGDISITIKNIASQTVSIQVSDEGPGIPIEELPNIFERFYRGDKARLRESGGTGLGLAISKEFIELHGGKISVENNPSAGSSFEVEIPIDDH